MMRACPLRASPTVAPSPPPGEGDEAQVMEPIEAEVMASSPSWSEIEGSETSDGDLMAVLQAVEDAMIAPSPSLSAIDGSETSDGELMAGLQAAEEADAEHETSRDWANASLTRTSRTPPSLTWPAADGWGGTPRSTVRSGLSAKFWPSQSL